MRWLFHLFLVGALLCSSTIPLYASTPADPGGHEAFEALQAAEILGIKKETERFLFLERNGDHEAFENEKLSLKITILRKLLLGMCQVRRASNKTDVELSYASDIMYREQHKQAAAFEFFNLLNFAQLAVLYTIAPESRLNNQFTQANIIGLVSAGLGITLPVASILYGKLYRVRNSAPPAFMKNTLDGAPVDATHLPALIDKYLDYPAQGNTKSRREVMFEQWKKYYGADINKKETLAGINDNKPLPLSWFNQRVLLLWSLRNHVQGLERELMALSNFVKTPLSPAISTVDLASSGLTPDAIEATTLLNLGPAVVELLELSKNRSVDKHRLELETLFLSRIIDGSLDVRIATNKVDQELNYNYDIILSELLSARGKALQRNFEMNFVQNGVSVAVAKTLFLKHYPKAAFETLVSSDGVGAALSGLALIETRGKRLEITSEPNSLADFLELNPDKYHFSPLITAFLNTPSHESKEGKSRKEELKAIWKRNRLSTLSIESAGNRHKLAAHPPAKYDTIKIVSSRLALLQSLKANLEFFDTDLLELLRQTGGGLQISSSAETVTDQSSDSNKSVSGSLTVAAREASHLLSIGASVVGTFKKANDRPETQALGAELDLVRKVLQALLEVRVTADKLDLEIVKETDMRDRMTRARDLGIAVTNNADFFQLNILGAVASGPLSLSASKRYHYYNDQVNIVSGLLVAGLSGAALLEQHGGYRPQKAEPNMLAEILSLKAAPQESFPPLIWNFLNSPNPFMTGESRRQLLMEYWTKTKVISINPGSHANAEKLSAQGDAHHWWCESIKLINNRINMLYAVRATVDLLDIGLAELLVAAE